MNYSHIQDILDHAYELLDQGQLAQADKVFADALSRQESNAEAWMMRGAINAESGAIDVALSCLERAIALKPDYSQAHFALGQIMHMQGNLEVARSHCQTAVESEPGFFEAWLLLGGLNGQIGAYQEAETCSLRALQERPDSVDAVTNLVNALLAQAFIHYQQGGLDTTGSLARRILEKNPAHADANYLLGILAAKHGKFEEAARYLDQAILSNSDDARYHFSRGVVFWSQGKMGEAINCYKKSLSLHPDDDEVRWAFTMAQIPIVYGANDDPIECRTRFSRELDSLIAWYENEGKAEQGYRSVGDHQPFLLSYQEADNRALFSKHGALCCRLMKRWMDSQDLHIVNPLPAEVIRIGIVSAQISDSSVWRAIVKGWFMHLDRQRFAIQVFHLGSKHDDTSDWARMQSSFYERGEKDLRQWVEIILTQQSDVLIYPDIGLDPMTTKLASMRLAKTQLAFWGVPETTGLPTIDYYLSAEDFEPPHAQDYYTEQLVLLPHMGCTYPRLAVMPKEPNLSGLGISQDRPILICPGAPFKYAPEHDRVFTEIAVRAGECQFVFFVNADRNNYSEILKQRLGLAFSQAGIDINRYVVFIPWQPSAMFFGLMRRAVVFLDSIGFSGFNTAIQAVECNLPIVTRQGKFMRGRFASGILQRMGLSELVTHSNEEYVGLAVRLVRDKAFHHDIKKQMEARSHVLFEDVAPTAAFQEFLANVVKKRPNT